MPLSDDQLNSTLEGIFSNGYGVIPKSVMCDSSLSTSARLIYAYYTLKSSNNGGWQPAPAEKTILADLGFTHAPFVRNRKTLIDAGLLCLRQQKKDRGGAFFTSGEFILPKDINKDVSASLLLQQGIYAHGYGLCPRTVLFNRNLGRNAKALYLLLCVYAPASTQHDILIDHQDLTMSSLITNYMSRNKIVPALAALQELDYVRVIKRCPLPNQYVLVLHPHSDKQKIDNLLSPQNDTTDTNHFDTTDAAQNDTTDTDHFDTADAAQNDTTDTNHFDTTYTAQNDTAQNDTAQNDTPYINTEYGITGLRNYNPSFSEREDGDEAIEGIKAMIQYNILVTEYGTGIADAIASCIETVLLGTADTVYRINGMDRRAIDVQSKFRRLNFEKVEFVIDSLRNNAGSIANPAAYLLTALYNAEVNFGINQIPFT